VTESDRFAKRRGRSRRPITDDEIPHLEKLGSELRRLRESHGMSRPVVARGAQVSSTTIALIEWACRRTRPSTLRRIVDVLVPDPAKAAAIVEHLLELGGPAVAPESQWANRLDRRRARRVRQRAKREALAAELAPQIAAELVKQLRVRQLDKKRWYGDG
jgi:hypothetical protein